MLLDSNIIIYLSNDSNLDNFLKDEILFASIVSKIEVLGFHKISEKKKLDLSNFFKDITILTIDSEIVDQSIALRQKRNISLGDAIIASSALVHNLPLVTANTPDFKWIDGIILINPLQ